SARPASGMEPPTSRSKDKVKPDKMQLNWALEYHTSVFERASSDVVLIESFYLQQQIHWEIEKYSSPRLSSPQTMRTMRNLHKLLSRMSLKQMIHFVRHSPVCDSFLDNVQTQMASFTVGNTIDVNDV
ncbi:unnamed protein product, partial [Symbiodinium sp. CCMP2592]